MKEINLQTQLPDIFNYKITVTTEQYEIIKSKYNIVNDIVIIEYDEYLNNYINASDYIKENKLNINIIKKHLTNNIIIYYLPELNFQYAIEESNEKNIEKKIIYLIKFIISIL